MRRFSIPQEVLAVANTLVRANYQAYLVGGCVRDLLMQGVAPRQRSGSSALETEGPRDWDIATNATPEEVQKLFSDTVYENEFGTVAVKTESGDPKLKVIEVTTFRLEGKYTDKRHPDEIKFAKTIEEDLARRDFTINAVALEIPMTKSQFPIKSPARLRMDEVQAGGQIPISQFRIIDPYRGQEDLRNRVIRTVGNPDERFGEDALRLLRAVRFAVELDFQIDMATRRSIEKNAGLLEMIAKERVRDEFEKMLMTSRAAAGVILLEELNLLQYVLKELREGIGVEQNLHHIYTVFEHSVRALDYAAKNNHSLEVRLAALLHDVGKPKSKRGEGRNCTFYGHEVIGAKMAVRALDRLRFPKETIEKVVHLVRYHMFYYNVGEVSASGVRRFLSRVGPEHVDDLLKVREADRIGSGTPKAVPYKLRHLLFMIEKVKHDPISPKMLAVRGDDVMRIADIPPGPKVGQILDVLLEEVLDEPKKNTRENLESRIQNLAGLSDEELQAMRAKARGRKEEFEAGIEEDIKKKYYVK
jgi:putative nucleotidyltransferase with HDIG domain